MLGLKFRFRFRVRTGVRFRFRFRVRTGVRFRCRFRVRGRVMVKVRVRVKIRVLRHGGAGLTTAIYPTASGLREVEGPSRTLPITRGAGHSYLKVVKEKA